MESNKAITEQAKLDIRQVGFVKNGLKDFDNLYQMDQ